MKITFAPTPTLTPTFTSGANKAASGETSAQQKPNTNTGDQVSLSGRAGLLQQLETIAEATPSVDSSKVAQLRQQIQDGSYAANPRAIAERLLSDSRQLLNR